MPESIFVNQLAAKSVSEATSTTPKAGEEAVLARRYAGALFALAEDAKSLDAVAEELSALARLWDESPEWRHIATDPRLTSEEAAASVEAVAKNSNFGKLTHNFLATVAANRRLAILPVAIEAFLEERAKRRGEFRAEVRAAHPLTSEQKESLAASLNAIAGGKVHIKISEDADLLGGLTVKMGSTFIDASVKTKLDHLERTLKGAA